MADIVITTDFSQVNQLNDTLKSTGNLFTRVVDSLLREETRAKRVTKALAKTTEDNLALIEKAEAIVAEKVQVAAQKREKARQREADRAEKEAKRIAAAAEKAAKAEAKLAEEIASNQAKAAQQSTAGLNQRLGVTGSSAMNSGAGFGALEQQVERLRLKYDQVYASSQLYEKSLKELDQAERLGVLSVKQHEAALESLNAEYQAFQSGVAQAGNRFAQHVNQTSDGMNKFGVAAQQTGYQVSDFIVQVQSGTNPLVAFSQQATQLAGLLYLLPPSMQAARIGMAGFSISMATATAGLTILIPLLAMIAMNFIGSGKESDEASKKIDKQAQAYENLKAKVEELRLARQMEASGAQSQDEQINLNEINALIRERNALQNQTLLLTSQEMIVASGGRSQLAAEYLDDQAKARQARIDEINLVLEQIEYERQLETAATRRANEVRNQYREAKAEQDKVNTAHAQQLSVMGRTKQESDNFVESLRRAYGLLAQSKTAASAMADEVQRAANAWLVNQAPGGKDYVANQYALYGQGQQMSKQTLAEAGPLYTPFPVPDKAKTGSGGSKTNPIDSLINQLQTERETINEWYAESQDTLKSASETELQIIGGYNEAKLRLEQEYQDRLKGIRDESHSTLLSDTGSMFSALASISEAGGKRALKAQAVLSAAATMIAAYETAVKAAAEAKTIPGRIAAYAGFLATGLKAAASIRSIGGIGGGTGGVGSATVAATASAPSPQTVFIDSISPESLYSGETLINLFEAFYDENDKRGKVFMVAR